MLTEIELRLMRRMRKDIADFGTIPPALQQAIAEWVIETADMERYRQAEAN